MSVANGMNGRVEGRIVRLLPEKRYGFVRVARTDYFFHKDDYEGNWNDLVASDKQVEVSCVIVESPKGTRVGDVRPIVKELL
jgi:hypothetical protein